MDTTINISVQQLEQIENVVHKSGIPRSKLITLSLKQTMREHRRFTRECRKIEYQDRAPVASWRCVHVEFNSRDYEFFQEMRLRFKRSISLLIALSIDRYLNRILHRLLKGTFNEDSDNYPFQNYIMINKTAGKAVCWKIYWGLPEENTDIFA